MIHATLFTASLPSNMTSAFDNNPINQYPMPSEVLNSGQQSEYLETVCRVTVGKIDHFLIGTQHKTDENMIKQSCFHRMMERCSILYTERGVYDFVPSSHTSIPESDHEYKHLRYRFCLDTAITLEAVVKRIPIMMLDVLSDPFEIRSYDEIIEVCNRLNGVDMQRAKTIHSNFVWRRDPCSMQKRRAKGRPESPDIYDIREERWAQILIPALKDATASICIAVGAVHVVGEDSLSHRFQKAGFKVEFIRSNCPEFAPPKELTPRFFAPFPVPIAWLINPPPRFAALLPSKPAEKEDSSPPDVDYDLDLLLGVTIYSASRVS